MLNSAETAYCLLICSSVEKAYVKRFVRVEFGQVNRIDMLFGIIVVVAVAGKSTKENAFVLAVPTIERKHYKPLVYCPRIRQSGYE